MTSVGLIPAENYVRDINKAVPNRSLEIIFWNVSSGG
jgi:hypothetical protein